MTRSTAFVDKLTAPLYIRWCKLTSPCLLADLMCALYNGQALSVFMDDVEFSLRSIKSSGSLGETINQTRQVGRELLIGMMTTLHGGRPVNDFLDAVTAAIFLVFGSDEVPEDTLIPTKSSVLDKR